MQEQNNHCLVVRGWDKKLNQLCTITLFNQHAITQSQSHWTHRTESSFSSISAVMDAISAVENKNIIWTTLATLRIFAAVVVLSPIHPGRMQAHLRQFLFDVACIQCKYSHSQHLPAFVPRVWCGLGLGSRGFRWSGLMSHPALTLTLSLLWSLSSLLWTDPAPL